MLRYNQSHKKTRVLVEMAFGKWKRRFHSLHSGLRIAIRNVPSLIISTAVLQNIAINFKEPDFDDESDDDIQPEEMVFGNDPVANNFSMRTLITENFFNQ